MSYYRKLHHVCAVLLVSFFAITASAKMSEEPRSFRLPDKSLESVQIKVLPKVDVERLLAEDKDRDRGKDSREPLPLRYAVAVDAELNLTNSGTWQNVFDGRLWRLRIQSPGARNQSLGITRFDMRKGAKLWVYNPTHQHIEGPYTASNRSHSGELWTPVIEGDEIVVEVFVPSGVAQPIVSISKVNQGYRGLGKTGEKGGFAGSEGACEIDVVCPEGTPWADPIRAVGVYTFNIGVNGFVCSGTMLNDTAVDFTPYFLTANHCTVDGTNDSSVVVYWNFQSPTCGTHGPGSTADNQSGSTYIASYAPSDFRLLQLATPNASSHVYFAGWDATGAAPATAVGIHHPSGDVKDISLSDTALQAASYGGSPDPAGDHWLVTWDSGTADIRGVTEEGSSGSCIFDVSTQLCVGQLHGGPSACGAPPTNLHDYYGRLSVSWIGGGTPTSRLKDWLDPGNTGVLSMHGDPHNITANGVHYDFQGAGEYVSLRMADGNEFQTRITPIPTAPPAADGYDSLATCVSLNTAVAARLDKHRVTIQPNISGNPDPSGMQVRIDGKLTSLGGGINVGSGRVMKTFTGYEIDFPNGTTLDVTPLWWSGPNKWYLNIDVFRSQTPKTIGGAQPGAVRPGGLIAATAPGSWLPALPNGSALGPMPASLHDRYNDLYKKFGDAWRVTPSRSLFDYAPGTSTATFTLKSWPPEKPPCVIPNTPPVKPTTQDVAQKACSEIRDKAMNANCVFDVGITGEKGFAKLYLISQRLRAGATSTTLTDMRNPTKAGEPAAFEAAVETRTPEGSVSTGTVQFIVDGHRAGKPVALNADGRAMWRTEGLKPAEHRVSAEYLPAQGSTLQPSSSGQRIHIVRE
jgi:lysyl endopeptidase